ncbi:hypothetical protein K491DRAFT_773273 [Lophiostoma macrostomum CBS 122681]|uniref:Tat pathway signal sequence n=1 Tax=Lophiostoma macrostomum CBS 122681 TaxID=1314788 RepID=A0A6A6TT59_9PLEO|nr:hypothetical protein K491DRAFT_773273 [Lophiostoma macrostomum CBS 122681]
MVKSQRSYSLLSSDDDTEVLERGRHRNHGMGHGKWFYCRILLILEIGHAIVLLLGYGVWAAIHSRSLTANSITYRKLSEYNASPTYGIRNAADPSPEAHAFWMDIQDTNGFIQVDAQWAESLDLPQTRTHPSRPDQKIYQINFFHSIHCLYRIRSRLIASAPLEQWPRNDTHTLHCLDHIRHNMMCHADLSLYGTDDYVVFDKAPDSQTCRDISGVKQWAKANAWAGYKDYWALFDWQNVEARVEEELRRHPGIRWDQYRDYYDPDIPGGYRLEFLDT